MSPPFRSIQFKGPEQQRGAIGLMAAVTLGLVLLFMLLVVDSGRLYLEQRKLQRVADLAVLEAVSRGGSCTAGTAPTYANESATRNSFTPGTVQKINTTCGTLVTGKDNLRTFKLDSTKSDAIRVIATTAVPTSVAGGLWSFYSNGKFLINTPLTASAVGAAPKGLLAQLTIRSTTLDIDSSKSKLLNSVWGGLAGGTLNLSLAGWQGLVNGKINLLNYLDQLAIDLNINAGGYTDVLNTKVQLTKLIDTAVKILTANGTTANVAVEGLLALKGAVGNVQVKLGDILKLQSGTDAAGLDTSLNVFQLAEAFVQLANISNGVAASVPLNVPGVVNGTVTLKIIEPPQLSAIGDPAKAKAHPTDPGSQIYVRTAQVRAGVTLNLPVLNTAAVQFALTNLVGPLTNTLNSLLRLDLAATLESVFCLVLLPCKQTDLKILPNASINVILEVASASSHVTDYSCSTATAKSLTTANNAGLLKVKFGDINMTNAFSSTSDVTVKPLPIIDIGSITCSGLLGLKVCDNKTRVPFYGGGVGLRVDSSIGSLPAAFSTHIYNQPPDVKKDPLYFSVESKDLASSLKTTLQGIQLYVYRPTGTSALGDLLVGVGDILGALVTAVTSLIGPLLSSIVDPLLNGVLDLLGISIDKVDVGANLTCGQGGRAQLVL